MFRILQICNKAPVPADDGSSIAVYNMAKGLIANGADLHLLAINTRKHYKEESLVPRDFAEKSRYRTVYRNTNPGFFGAAANLFSGQSYFVSRFYFRDFEKALIEKLGEADFDVVQIEGLFMCVYIDAIRKHSNAKIVLRAHNVEYLIWERHLKSEAPGVRKSYLSLQADRLRKFELACLQRVDAVVSITEVDQKIFEQFTGTPVFSCISGLDLKLYQPGSSRQLKRGSLFYFASMDWLPNQQAVDWFLANCWDTVLAAVPDATFVVAGKNMPERYKGLNARNVKVIPAVPDARQFYMEHEIMVVPLLSGSGLRIKIIEGMAYGKPIVSTSVGAEGIHGRKGEEFLIADDPSGFAEAVIRVLKDDQLKKDLSANALKFASAHFDSKTVTRQLIDFYKTLNV